MKALITGGLGFIGGIVARRFLDSGHSVMVVDRDQDGPARRLFPDALLACMSIDDARVRDILHAFSPDVVLHFAARASVGEGERDPLEYARNNVGAFATFLQMAVGLQNRPAIIHAGSCAVYGNPRLLPVDEMHSTEPVSWYGKTKLAAEELVTRSGLRHVAFRYFNVVGTESGIIEKTEGRIVPTAVECAINSLPFMVNGTDHPTGDGTCVRDYVHVSDLADAHLSAAERLISGVLTGAVMNLGSGRGRSVLEVLGVIEDITGKRITRKTSSARPGDASSIYASVQQAERLLEWRPRRSFEDAVSRVWECRRKGG